MAQGAGRIVCPRCGTNNFDTVRMCWKCSAPLGAPAAPGVRPPASAAGPAPSGVPSASPPLAAGYAPEALAYRAAAGAAQVGLIGNPGTANKAALWLGLLMPYFGLPIGLAFMMCDDRRRQEVGRICVLWSVLSGVIHFLMTVAGLIGMREMLFMALNAARGAKGPSGMGGGSGMGEP